MLYKEIAEFIQEKITGCSFIGIAADGELFVAFNHDDEELIWAANVLLKKQFPSVTKMTVMEKLDVAKATKMIEQLNEMLDESKTPLLDLEDF